MIATTRAPRRDATENRLALLEAARIELNLDEDASLETIAARAGLSRRSVYGHFATRDELLRELITVGAARVSRAVVQVVHRDPVVRLALVATTLWREVEDVRVMAVFAVRGPLKSHTATALEPLRELVRQAIADGVVAGSIRNDIAVPRLARLVEDAALTALEEASRERIAAAEVHRLVILLVLGTLGMSASESGRFIDAHTELDWKAR